MEGAGSVDRPIRLAPQTAECPAHGGVAEAGVNPFLLRNCLGCAHSLLCSANLGGLLAAEALPGTRGVSASLRLIVCAKS